MMGSKKGENPRDSDLISASEIGQFHFCSMSWYLHKCGYKPKSPMLDTGIKKHVDLGDFIDNTQKNMRQSRFLAVIGYLLLTVAILIFLFEVIL